MDQEKIKLNGEDLKVLRTYTSDMADAIRENEASVIKIALAEKEKREREGVYKKAEGTKTSKIFFVLGGIFLIVVAIIGSSILISKKEEISTPIVKDTDTFILYDSHLSIDVTNITRSEDLFVKINQNISEGQGLVRAIFLDKNINGISEDLTTGDFFSVFKISAPNSLIRSLSNKYLLGQYLEKNSSNKKTENFLIFETSNYNQTYASLLSWENTMPKDLSGFFNYTNQNDYNTQKKWQDIVVNNKDTRVLYRDDGQAILYYTFVNNNLIITNNIDVLKEIISRLIIKSN